MHPDNEQKLMQLMSEINDSLRRQTAVFEELRDVVRTIDFGLEELPEDVTLQEMSH